jgi:hypothetical protein
MEAGEAGFEPGRDYPGRIVDHREAARQARSRIMKAKSQAGARQENERVYRKHGSRKGSNPKDRARGRDASRFERRSGKRGSKSAGGPGETAAKAQSELELS